MKDSSGSHKGYRLQKKIKRNTTLARSHARWSLKEGSRIISVKTQNRISGRNKAE